MGRLTARERAVGCSHGYYTAIRPKMVRWLADILAEPLPAAVLGLNAANLH